MKNETNNKNERINKKVGLTILATAGVIGSAGLGVLCYLLAKDNKVLRIEKEMCREAYEGVAEKLIQQGETAELVKRVVGGPLIDRLIKNEEKTLSRIENKINILMSKNIENATKIVIKEMEEKRQNVIETIADFVKVRDSLK